MVSVRTIPKQYTGSAMLCGFKTVLVNNLCILIGQGLNFWVGWPLVNHAD